jgi:hypothetical protein
LAADQQATAQSIENIDKFDSTVLAELKTSATCLEELFDIEEKKQSQHCTQS